MLIVKIRCLNSNFHNKIINFFEISLRKQKINHTFALAKQNWAMV